MNFQPCLIAAWRYRNRRSSELRVQCCRNSLRSAICVQRMLVWKAWVGIVFRFELAIGRRSLCWRRERFNSTFWSPNVSEKGKWRGSFFPLRHLRQKARAICRIELVSKVKWPALKGAWWATAAGGLYRAPVETFLTCPPRLWNTQ